MIMQRDLDILDAPGPKVVARTLPAPINNNILSPACAVANVVAAEDDIPDGSCPFRNTCKYPGECRDFCLTSDGD